MALRSIPVGWCVEQVPSHLLQTFTHRDVKVKYFHHTIFFPARCSLSAQRVSNRMLMLFVYIRKLEKMWRPHLDDSKCRTRYSEATNRSCASGFGSWGRTLRLSGWDCSNHLQPFFQQPAQSAWPGSKLLWLINVCRKSGFTTSRSTTLWTCWTSTHGFLQTWGA